MSNRNTFRFPVPDEVLEFNGERFTTAVDGEIRHEHFHRYLFALQFCKGKSVLDVASGEGYGSALLATVAADVIGVDQAEDAVRHANTNYYDRNTSFRVGSADKLPIADCSIDVVISFETLEHIVEHDAFLAEIARVLRPDGLLVMSSPDRDVYSGENQIENPNHKKELTRTEFQELILRHFSHAKFLAQSSLTGSVIAMDRGAPHESGIEGFRRLYGTFFEQHPGLCSPMYLLCVASKTNLPEIVPGVFHDRVFQLGLYAELQRRHEEILRKECEIADLHGEIETLHNSLDQGSRELSERGSRIAQLQMEIERVKNDLRESNERVRALTTEKRSLRDVQKRLESRSAEIARSASQRQEKFETELRELACEISRLSRLSEDRSVIIAARERQVSDRDEQIANLKNSLSWKLAAPLRGVIDGLVALRNLLYKTPVFSLTGKPLAKVICSLPVRCGTWLLPHNPLFDEPFYRQQYPDLRNASNLWAHYLGYGADEGRNPHPFFETSFYREQNSDVTARGINPLVHFLEFGASEGRNPHPSFETLFYLETYPEVRGKINPLLHYWLYGRAEGRRIARGPGPPSELVPSAAKDHNSENQSAQSTLIAPAAQQGPLISVIVPTYNTPARYLRLAIDSVRKQTYTNWLLCIYDDGSTKEETLQSLKEIAALDHRISVQFGSKNQGISRASNAALAMAHGEYVAMLDHDDELPPDALQEVAQLLSADRTIDVVYTDQQYIGPDSELQEPFFKTDWSPELFRGVMFVGHLLVVRLDLARQVAGFNPQFDKVQDFEFMLRVSESTKRIRHLPKILYYWRRIPGSVAFGGDEKGKIEHLQAAAVNGQLTRLGISALGVPHPCLAHRLTIEPKERTNFPSVNVMVRSTAGQRWPIECMRSVVEHSTYPNLTFTIAADLVLPGGPSKSRLQLRPAGSWEAPSGSDFIVWIDADLEVLTTNWIEYLLLYCEQADIACTSPLLTLPDGTVWYAGLVLGMDGIVGFPMRGLPADSDGYAGSLSCTREVSAISGECFMISSASLSEAGGLIKFYETSLYQGADLSLRAFTMKRRNILTPRVRVRKTGPLQDPAGWDLDRALFSDRWTKLTKHGDPYHNPNFELSSPGFSLPRSVAAQAS